MSKHGPRARRYVLLGCAWSLGCLRPALDVDEDSTSGGSSTDSEWTSTTTVGTTTVGTTTTSTTTPVTADGGSSGTTTGSEGWSSLDTGIPENPGEIGDACIDPSECESGACFVVGPLGGICSECDESADCEAITGFGCNFGNPLTGMPAVCGTGDPGQGCETPDDCVMGLFCTVIIEVPGILSTATCSECNPGTNDGCVGGDICTPTHDITNIGGSYDCAPPGSVPNDSGCNLTGDGTECASGQCAPAALMGIPIVAMCSPCNEDADCGGGMTCQLPEIAIEGNVLVLVPGMCV